MKTTVDISPPLLKKAQTLARKQGTTFKALVEAGLKVILSTGHTEGKTVTIQPHVFTATGKTNKTWSQISEVIAQDELTRFKS